MTFSKINEIITPLGIRGYKVIITVGISRFDPFIVKIKVLNDF